jgi:hypothetical protein
MFGGPPSISTRCKPKPNTAKTNNANLKLKECNEESLKKYRENFLLIIVWLGLQSDNPSVR